MYTCRHPYLEEIGGGIRSPARFYESLESRPPIHFFSNSRLPFSEKLKFRSLYYAYAGYIIYASIHPYPIHNMENLGYGKLFYLKSLVCIGNMIALRVRMHVGYFLFFHLLSDFVTMRQVIIIIYSYFIHSYALDV